MRNRLMVGYIFALVFVIALIPIATAYGGSNPEKKIKLELSSTLAPGSCVELAADRFKKLVEKASGGRITVVRYPSGELYGPKSEIEAVAKGSIAMAVVHGPYSGSRSPILEFICSFGAQGCWDDYDHYYRFLDLPEVREITTNELKAKMNVKPLGIIAYGNSLVGNRKRPIHTVEDFKGLKIRNAGSAQAAMYRALGVIPTELSSREVYMALKRGTIEGATSGPSRFYLSKWYEVTPYLTQDYTLPYLSFYLSINFDTWNGLSKEDQQILVDCGREAEEWSRIYVVKETADFYEKLQRGLTKELYFLPTSETAKIRGIVRPVMYALSIKRMGKEMGERLWGLLDKARK